MIGSLSMLLLARMAGEGQLLIKRDCHSYDLSAPPLRMPQRREIKENLGSWKWRQLSSTVTAKSFFSAGNRTHKKQLGSTGVIAIILNSVLLQFCNILKSY